MSVAQVLANARVAAETRMLDACTITRQSPPSGPVDPLTGLQSQAAAEAVYSGKCFLQILRVQNPNPSNVAGDFPVTEVMTLVLPAKSAVIYVEDIVVLTAAPDHPQDVGLRFRVTSLNTASQRKSQRCQVEAIVG